MTPDQAQASQEIAAKTMDEVLADCAKLPDAPVAPPTKPKMYDYFDDDGKHYQLAYDYTVAKKFVKERGLIMNWAQLEGMDIEFQHLGLTELQVNALVIDHTIIVDHLLTPQSWPWKARIAIAWMFIRGRKKAAVNGK